MKEIVSVIGVRGFGLPVCRRLGQAGRLLIGDNNGEVLERAREVLAGEGYDVIARQIDIARPESVTAFAAEAERMGRLRSMICTAGISGSMGDPTRIFEVNMLGTLNVLDAFAPLAVQGSVAVIIASNAGYMTSISADEERILAHGSRDELRAMFDAHEGRQTGLGTYCLSKRGNQLRIEALATAWGRRGARILTVSPGVMATPMTLLERDAGSPVDQAAVDSPLGRYGYPEDIAAAVAWLVGPEASFITGVDLRVDGGLAAAMKWSQTHAAK